MGNHMTLILFMILLTGTFICFIMFVFKVLRGNSKAVFNYEDEFNEVIKIEKPKKINNSGGQTLIGYSSGNKVYTEDNAKHIFCCGTTGSGKTVAIANYIVQACKNNYPMVIIDGKGDTNNGSLLQIVNDFSKKYNRKLYVINLSDSLKSDKYNPFQDTNPTVCKDMLINMTAWSEEHYKLNTERYLLRLFQLLIKSNIMLTFENIIKNIDTLNFLELSKNLQENQIITKEEHLSNITLSKASGEIAEEATARFSILFESELGVIFEGNGIDIYTALKENAIILFVLNPLLYPETSNLMGKLLLIDCKKAVSKLFNSEVRKFFIFDEISTYASTSLTDLVNKSRSANITCILATQSLSDLDYAVNENYKEQIIENCNNYILLRQNSGKNAENWANIIGTKKSADVTYQVGDEKGTTAPTGRGTIKFNKEYIFHPDEIKSLKTGEAFYISKDKNTKLKININKPF
jgi:Type IV secretory pathway, VirD4 components